MPSLASGNTQQNPKTSSRLNTFFGKHIKLSPKRVGFMLLQLVVFVWVAFYLLMANINLIHPWLEEALSNSLHRQVKLSALTCRLGLNGLTLSSNSLIVSDNHFNKGPFLKSGPVDLSIAFLPLMRGRVIIKHIDLNSPEVWVYKIGPKYWNYSDLLVDGPEIRFVQIENGKLHVDQYTPPYKQSTSVSYFDKISLKLVMPKNRAQWPFYLYFRIPDQNIKESTPAFVRLDVMGYGHFSEWKTNRYKFNLTTKNVRSSYLRPFIINLPYGLEDRLITMEATGEGVYNRGIKGQVKSQLSDVNYLKASKTAINPNSIFANSSFIFSPNSMSWTDLDIKFTNFDSIFAQFLPRLDKAHRQFFSSLFAGGSQTSIRSNITVNQNKVNIQKLEIPLLNTFLRISGYVLQPDEEAHLKFNAQDIKITDDSKLEKLFGLEKPLPVSFIFTGTANLDGQLDVTKQDQKTNVEASVRDGAIYLSNKKNLANNVSGKIIYKQNSIELSDFNGQWNNEIKTSPGKFQLSGFVETGPKHKCNLKLIGNHLDLKQFIEIAKSYKIKLPDIINNIQGRASVINCNITDSLSTPKFAITIVPEDMRLLSSINNKNSFLHLSSGTIGVTNNEVSLKDVSIPSGTNAGKLIVNGLFVSLNSKPELKWAKLSLEEVEINELHNFIANSPDLKTIFAPYIAWTTENKISLSRGRAYGNIYWHSVKEKPSIDGSLGFYNVAGKIGINSVPFYRASGVLNFKNQDLYIQDFQANIARSKFIVTGNVRDIFDKFNFQILLKAFLFPQDINRLIPSLADVHHIEMNSSKALFLKANIITSDQSQDLDCSIKANGSSKLSIKFGKWGTIYQPADTPISFDTNLSFRKSDNSDDNYNNYVQVQRAHLNLGDAKLQGSGKYTWASNKSNLKNKLDFVLTNVNPIPAALVFATWDPTVTAKDMSGTFKGTLAMSGTVDNLLTHGNLLIQHLSVPAFNIVDLNGKITTPQWTVFNMSDFVEANSSSQAKLDFQSGSFSGLNIKDLHADIIYENKQIPQILLKNAIATISGGTVAMEGWYQPSTKESGINISMTKLQVDQFLLDLMEHSSAVTGLADADLKLTSRGTDMKTWRSNLDGTGQFTVYRGLAPSFGKLQNKLIHANLLQQGIFGFNVNNLLQSMLPVQTGRFNEVTGNIDIKSGIASIQQLRFDGNDMRLRAAGNLDLSNSNIDLEVAGYIPRVSSSLIPGPFGEVSKRFTIQKFLHTITFRQLESLPPFPLLGELASDNPRAFTFRVLAPATDSKLVSQSIEKSFHWLPNKPNASAHPLPGQKLSTTPVNSP